MAGVAFAAEGKDMNAPMGPSPGCEKDLRKGKKNYPVPTVL
ncbi:hypothetical protein GMO_05810 [Gluconobacter morbifer G707]|uniref:Uncharacterized protein n=1 Tax=Gluconobacter morbifer G707 TaxID=1088869 RepID=G6XGG6_9PROT|nr:hypothetical protein GMO_05810 [Gluconobacter morbifer G707]